MNSHSSTSTLDADLHITADSFTAPDVGKMMTPPVVPLNNSPEAPTTTRHHPTPVVVFDSTLLLPLSLERKEDDIEPRAEKKKKKNMRRTTAPFLAPPLAVSTSPPALPPRHLIRGVTSTPHLSSSALDPPPVKAHSLLTVGRSSSTCDRSSRKNKNDTKTAQNKKKTETKKDPNPHPSSKTSTTCRGAASPASSTTMGPLPCTPPRQMAIASAPSPVGTQTPAEAQKQSGPLPAVETGLGQVPSIIAPPSPFPGRRHPCIRLWGKCNFPDGECKYSQFPYETCLRHLKNRCGQKTKCTEVHFTKEQIAGYYLLQATSSTAATLPNPTPLFGAPLEPLIALGMDEGVVQEQEEKRISPTALLATHQEVVAQTQQPPQPPLSDLVLASAKTTAVSFSANPHGGGINLQQVALKILFCEDDATQANQDAVRGEPPSPCSVSATPTPTGVPLGILNRTIDSTEEDYPLGVGTSTSTNAATVDDNISDSTQSIWESPSPISVVEGVALPSYAAAKTGIFAPELQNLSECVTSTPSLLLSTEVDDGDVDDDDDGVAMAAVSPLNSTTTNCGQFLERFAGRFSASPTTSAPHEAPGAGEAAFAFSSSCCSPSPSLLNQLLADEEEGNEEKDDDKAVSPSPLLLPSHLPATTKKHTSRRKNRGMGAKQGTSAMQFNDCQKEKEQQCEESAAGGVVSADPFGDHFLGAKKDLQLKMLAKTSENPCPFCLPEEGRGGRRGGGGTAAPHTFKDCPSLTHQGGHPYIFGNCLFIFMEPANRILLFRPRSYPVVACPPGVPHDHGIYSCPWGSLRYNCDSCTIVDIEPSDETHNPWGANHKGRITCPKISHLKYAHASFLIQRTTGISMRDISLFHPGDGRLMFPYAGNSDSRLLNLTLRDPVPILGTQEVLSTASQFQEAQRQQQSQRQGVFYSSYETVDAPTHAALFQHSDSAPSQQCTLFLLHAVVAPMQYYEGTGNARHAASGGGVPSTLVSSPHPNPVPFTWSSKAYTHSLKELGMCAIRDTSLLVHDEPGEDDDAKERLPPLSEFIEVNEKEECRRRRSNSTGEENGVSSMDATTTTTAAAAEVERSSRVLRCLPGMDCLLTPRRVSVPSEEMLHWMQLWATHQATAAYNNQNSGAADPPSGTEIGVSAEVPLPNPNPQALYYCCQYCHESSLASHQLRLQHALFFYSNLGCLPLTTLSHTMNNMSTPALGFLFEKMMKNSQGGSRGVWSEEDIPLPPPHEVWFALGNNSIPCAALQ